MKTNKEQDKDCVGFHLARAKLDRRVEGGRKDIGVKCCSIII